MLRIRKYPHFDADLTIAEANRLVNDPQAVASHAYFPFIQHPKKWTKFAVKGKKGSIKSRPIMYASRRDSCIYSHYRSILNLAYEDELQERKISDCVLAYRKISRDDASGNKNNINFAHDVFKLIKHFGNCTVLTLDISKFFDGLLHNSLKKKWMQLMKFDVMPPDHYSVFRNVTSYSRIDRSTVYQALSFIGTRIENNKSVTGYLVKQVPLHLCSSDVFRKSLSMHIEKNKSNFGIPQGSPISDVLANLYMLDFDTEVAAEVKAVGGYYFRYSDDIIVISPGHENRISKERITCLLEEFAQHLTIQAEKSTVHRFSKQDGEVNLLCRLLHGSAGKNGLEYLGFRFDGRHVFIKDSTISRLHRKMTYAVKGHLNHIALTHKTSSSSELKKHFNADFVLKKFYKIRNFEEVSDDPCEWTFWTYIIRAQRIFGNESKAIERQVRGFRRCITYKAEKLIDAYVNK